MSSHPGHSDQSPAPRGRPASETGYPGAGIGADVAEQPGVFESVLSNQDQLAEARAVLGGARLIRLVGLGSSRHAAGYGAVAAELIGGTPARVMAAPGHAVDQPDFHPDEVVITVSQSGRTPALVRVAEDARRRGVPSIAITNSEGAPLDELATVAVPCGAGPERVVAATKSVTGCMLVLRCLVAPVTQDSGNELVAAVRGALDAPIAVAGLDLPDAVVWSGFAAEWLADEAGLKFAEVAGRSVLSESLVDYLHGPVAALRSPLVFAEAGDPNLSPVAPGYRVGADASASLRVDSTGDPSLDALVRLVVAQRLAVGWALAIGEDPDSDRGLSKVTTSR